MIEIPEIQRVIVFKGVDALGAYKVRTFKVIYENNDIINV